MGLFSYQCKKCSARVVSRDDEVYQCTNCAQKFTLLKGDDGAPIDLIRYKQEPLMMPKGSVRALVTLALAFSLFYQVKVYGLPNFELLQLLLTMVFYYFGFRKRDKNIIVGGRIVQAEI